VASRLSSLGQSHAIHCISNKPKNTPDVVVVFVVFDRSSDGMNGYISQRPTSETLPYVHRGHLHTFFTTVPSTNL
jgi:hypothetical protein